MPAKGVKVGFTLGWAPLLNLYGIYASQTGGFCSSVRHQYRNIANAVEAEPFFP